MPNKKINISEIAKNLGVSKSTVSKALNDSKEISEATKIKIQRYASKHHYRPNKLAINLKSGKTKTIGVIVPSIQNFFFARVLRGIEKAASSKNYSIITCMSYESIEKELNSVALLENGLVDGFIIALAEETQVLKQIDHIKGIIEQDKPVVMFDRVTKDLICNQVIVNDKEAVCMATKRLIELGCNDIALVSTIDHLSVGKQRKKGYKKALRESNLSIKESHMITVKNTIIDIKIAKLLKKQKIDGILALDEDAVFATYRAAKFVGITIPTDMAVIGYLSDKVAKNISPSLTTLNQNGIKLGVIATELLIDRLNKEQRGTFQKKYIKTTLLERESTKCFGIK